MALVAGQAVHPESGQLLDPSGHREGLLGRVDPGAVHAGVHLDQDPERGPGLERRGGKGLRVADVVDVDQDVRLARQERRGTPLVRVHQLVRDEDVVGARRGP